MARCGQTAVESMARRAHDAFGRIDVLVNNAALCGGLKGARFEELAEAQWDKVMRVDVTGPGNDSQ